MTRGPEVAAGACPLVFPSIRVTRGALGQVRATAIISRWKLGASGSSTREAGTLLPYHPPRISSRSFAGRFHSVCAVMFGSSQVEMVVGKALATDGDPDYDSENPLYNGATTMIRPYPLPKSAKAAQDGAAADQEAPEGGVGDGANGTEYETKSDPEMEDQIGAMHPEYNGPQDLEMIVEESEEDRTSSRYSETRYSEASRYSDTYSDYGDRPSKNALGGPHRGSGAPMR